MDNTSDPVLNPNTPVTPPPVDPAIDPRNEPVPPPEPIHPHAGTDVGKVVYDDTWQARYDELLAKNTMLASALQRCLPIVQSDADMTADITRHAPLPKEEQRIHDATETDAERLVEEIPKLLTVLPALALAKFEAWQENVTASRIAIAELNSTTAELMAAKVAHGLCRQLIVDCQAAVAAYLPSGSGVTDTRVINQLIELLDGPQEQQALKAPGAAIQDVRKLCLALESANSVCRSMWQIVDREFACDSKNWVTNWPAFRDCLDRELKSQHAILYPDTAAVAGPLTDTHLTYPTGKGVVMGAYTDQLWKIVDAGLALTGEADLPVLLVERVQLLVNCLADVYDALKQAHTANPPAAAPACDAEDLITRYHAVCATLARFCVAFRVHLPESWVNEFIKCGAIIKESAFPYPSIKPNLWRHRPAPLPPVPANGLVFNQDTVLLLEDSLRQIDSGMHGVKLAHVDVTEAVECKNRALTAASGTIKLLARHSASEGVDTVLAAIEEALRK